MRTLVRFSMPAVSGNKAIADGRLGPVIAHLVETLRPEASYFCTLGGKRTGLIIFDMADVSQIPAIAEPLFTNLDAEVEFVPLMSGDDLQKGLAAARSER